MNQEETTKSDYQPVAQKSGRPVWVTVIAVLMIFGLIGTLSKALAGILVLVLSMSGVKADTAVNYLNVIIITITSLAISGVVMATSIGLLKLKKWAYRLYMILAGLSLVSLIVLIIIDIHDTEVILTYLLAIVIEFAFLYLIFQNKKSFN